MRPARSRLAATLRTAAAAVALGVVMAGGLMLTAGPAAAHGADSAEDTGAPAATVTLTSGEVADDAWAGGASSNYLVTADRLPDVDGLRLEVRRAGTRLVLTNPSPRVVVILDQRGDPFVRVGPDGTFENVGAADDVRWVRRSAGHTVAWTDGRARWKSDPPPAVTADPGTRHTLLNWRIPVEVDGVPDVMSDRKSVV